MLSDKRILIVEDEKPLLQAISKKLEDVGFAIASARSVDQALSYLNDSDFGEFSAVWLDHYLLGDKTGLDFLAECKKEGSPCKDVPVFVVTNTGGHDKAETYMELGATEYYVKSNSSLKEIIESIKKKLGY